MKVDKAGDKIDKSGVESTFKALQSALVSLRALYFKPTPK